jgi:hypothetical protein
MKCHVPSARARHLAPPASRRFAAAAAAAAPGTWAGPGAGPEQPLREWLAREGGFFHPALRLVNDAPSGCRGVVATVPIPLAELEAHGPLLVRPCSLGAVGADTL